MFQAFKLNLRYIKALNSCSIATTHAFLYDMLQHISMNKAFQRKRYVWNFARGKDFYKTLAQFISSYMIDIKCQPFAIEVYNEVIKSTNSEDIKRAFTKAIMKHTPFLTLTSVQYMSMQRLETILSQHGTLIYVEPKLQPIIDRINQLEDEITTLTNFM